MSMNRRKRMVSSVCALGTTIAVLCLLVGASSASASGLATVTVRVVGLTGTTLLPQTQVTTTTTPIDPDGNPAHTCSGTSAAGALDDAVRGNWVGLYENTELGYQIDGIQGLNFPPFSAKPDAYWSFWMNDAPEEVGACGQELSSGDNIVFFAQCDAKGTDCPSSETEPEHFLTEVVPASAQVGTPVAVSVGALNTTSGAPESSLPSGLTVSAGAVTASPNTQGVATLTFPSTGTYTVEATAPDSVPSAPQTLCIHNGNDGLCGTTVGGTVTGTSALPEVPPAINPTDLPKIVGIESGRTYRRSSAPRLLAGVVDVPEDGTLRKVRIGLKRKYRGRCYDFNGARGQFVHMKCSRPVQFFSVGSSQSFSYLLPSRLTPGQYVYEIQAINDAGQTTTITAGISRVTFEVK